MPIFEYKGIDGNSKNVSGLIDAESDKAARAKLRKQRIFVTKIMLEGSGSGLKRRHFFKGIDVTDIASMTRQLAVLLNANIPLIDSIIATGEQVEHPEIRKALAEIKEKVSEGGRLGDSMQVYPKIFDSIYINMVKAGEASGALDKVLTRLADYKESQAELKAKVKSAMMYPVIMLLVAGGMLTYIFTSVIPKITKVFEKKKMAMPLPTEIVINITYIIENYWFLVLIAMVLMVLAYISWSKTPSGRRRIDEFVLNMPLFGELNKKIAVSRLARTLSTLLNSGVQLLPGLDIVRNVMDNVVLSKVIENVMVSVKEGESLADPLKRSGRFPSVFLHMVTVGEKTGQLESMLEKVAETYDREITSYVDGMTSILTPVMLVVMGGVIAFIVAAVLMPILQLTGKG